MLPNFEKLNDLFNKAVTHAIKQLARSDGLLAQIKSHAIHEGRLPSIRRPDDTVDATELVSSEAKFEMAFKEIENVTLEKIINSIISMASQFNEQQAKHLFGTLEKVTEKTGQVHDAKGKPLTNDDIILLMGKAQIDFEKDKEHGDSSFVTSPQMAPVFARLDDEMKRSPELQKKWKAMLERKKGEYREREADRNLAG